MREIKEEEIKEFLSRVEKLKAYVLTAKEFPACRLPPVSVILSAIFDYIVEIEECLKIR